MEWMHKNQQRVTLRACPGEIARPATRVVRRTKRLRQLKYRIPEAQTMTRRRRQRGLTRHNPRGDSTSKSSSLTGDSGCAGWSPENQLPPAATPPRASWRHGAAQSGRCRSVCIVYFAKPVPWIVRMDRINHVRYCHKQILWSIINSTK